MSKKNPKHQAPSAIEAPILKSENDFGWNLVVGAFLQFGIWCLELP